MKKNVEPYLKLIGYAALEKVMGGMFQVASIWADELDQLIDKTEAQTLDEWYTKWGGAVPYWKFHSGLKQLEALDGFLEIKWCARRLLKALPEPCKVEV